MNRITNILNRTLIPHNQRFREIWVDAFPFGVDPDQFELVPAALDDVCDAEVELAGHDLGVRFVGEGVEVLEGDGVDFVVDVEAFDVGAVVLHYDVYELVDGCWKGC